MVKANNTSEQADWPFLSGGGEMGMLMRAQDWAATAVGPVAGWPQSLRTTVSILLNSKFPMFLWWGPELTCFYNDAYRPSLGNEGKHPSALGSPGAAVWPEIWPVIKPLIDQVLSGGEATWSEDQLIPIYRNGRLEDVYWTFSYSAVKEENGAINGVLVVCNETTGQVSAANKYRQHDERFQNLVREAPVGMAVLIGPEMRVDIANELYGKLIDRRPEELLGKPLFDIIPEAATPFLDLLLNVLYHNEPLSLSDQYYAVFVDGRRKEGYLNIIYQPYKDYNGKTIGVMALCHDITEQYLVRQQLEQAEAKARLAIETADLGTYEIDLVTDRMITSDRFNSIWGISCASRTELADYIHPEDRVIRALAHSESLETGILQYEARLKEGIDRWVRVKGKVKYNEAQQPVSVSGVIQDITEQKKFARQLAELIQVRTNELSASEDRYHKMIAEVEDYAIISLDEAGIIQNWNKGAERIKGYREEEIVGRSFKTFYRQEDQERGLPDRIIEEAKHKGKAVQEGLRQRKDGSTFWASVVITAIHDKEDKVIGFSKVTRDLTERKNAEDQIFQYNQELKFQNEELKQFAFIASHDMKEPLRKIIYYNSYLQEQIAERLNDKEKDFFSRSTGAAKRMQNLIDDILSYSQTAFTQDLSGEVDLNQVFREVSGNLRERIQEAGAIITSEELPVLKGIPHQLLQLFDNLLNNAIKYRSREQPCRIKITCSRVNGIAPGSNDGDYYKISIADNGIGFDPAYGEKIFDLFSRLETRGAYDGSGIGLSICRKIVQNHNGVIKANAQPGEGACFDIYLPLL